MNLFLILAAVGLGTLAIVLYVVSRKPTRGTSQALKYLREYADANGARISDFDDTHYLAIGFSAVTNQLFFCKIMDEKRILLHVNIADVQAVLLNKTTIRRADGDDAINTISLVFQNRNMANPVRQFEFYNLNSDSLSVYRELELAMKWKNFVSERCKAGSRPDAVVAA